MSGVPSKKITSLTSDITQLKEIQKELARKNLIHFANYIMEDYEPSWHHKYLADKLMDFIFGDLQRLIINISPQTGKSQLSCRFLPAFILGHFPKTKIGITSYSADLANGFNRDVQEIVASEAYKELFPHVSIPESSAGGIRRQSEFKVQGGGGVVSVGAGGALTGKSLDVGIIDDLYKNYEEASSQTILESRMEWFQSTFRTRFGKTGKILMLFTRWSEDDLAGQIMRLEPERWEKIIIPALTTTKYLRNKPDADPRTEVDQPIWEEKFSKEDFLIYKKQNPKIFSCLYQQDPAPAEGNILNPKWMKQVNWDVIRYHATSMVWNFFVDTAYTTKTENDPSAIIACAYWNDVLYVRNVATRRFEIQDLIDFIKNWTEENGYSYESRIYVEPHASGLSVIQSMRYQMPELNVMAFKYPKLNGRTVWDKDKRTKAYAIAPKIEAGQVALLEGNYIDDFAYEVGAFPNSNHDDQVDVLVMACFDSFLRGKKRFISIRK